MQEQGINGIKWCSDCRRYRRTLNITTAPGNSGSYTVISTVSGCASLVSVATSVTINPLPLVTPVVTPATPHSLVAAR
ncbi:MAG: hypothetical protein IPJ20_18475 [Flammeovirgaceae bacterium]|nr:hypothetical protein [Flammeovirgaceae bacterium]